MNTIRLLDEHIIWFKAERKRYIAIPCINPRDYSLIVESEFGLNKLPRTKRWQFNKNVKTQFNISFIRFFTKQDARIMAHTIIKNHLFDLAMEILEEKTEGET